MPYKYNERYRHKFKPKKYKVTNLHDYNQALKNRGDITIWFEKESINKWYAKPTHKHGGQLIYSNEAIEIAGIISLVFHLPLRQTTGFLFSISKLMHANFRIPDFSMLSRRFQKLKIDLKVPTNTQSMHIIIDASGLSVYDANEFHKAKKGLTKFKGYRMLHIAIEYT